MKCVKKKRVKSRFFGKMVTRCAEFSGKKKGKGKGKKKARKKGGKARKSKGMAKKGSKCVKKGRVRSKATGKMVTRCKKFK